MDEYIYILDSSSYLYGYEINAANKQWKMLVILSSQVLRKEKERYEWGVIIHNLKHNNSKNVI